MTPSLKREVLTADAIPYLIADSLTMARIFFDFLLPSFNFWIY